MPNEQRLPGSAESNSEDAVDSVDAVDSPRGQCSRKRKQSSIKGRRKPFKDISSVLGKTKKKTPAKNKPVTESANANGMQKLTASAKLLENKAAPAAAVNRCWSWEHWRQFGEEPLKSARYDDLKNQLEQSGKMPHLHCIHCPKVMACNTRTKRQQHLLFHCNGFSKSRSAVDARVLADKEELMQKKATHFNVRPHHLVNM
jgi:hypothetical protein